MTAATSESAPTPAEHSMREALSILVANAGGRCENTVFRDGQGAPLGNCFTHDTRTADARYTCDRACTACIAHAGLTGAAMVTGVGPEAEAEQTRAAMRTPTVGATVTTSDGAFDVDVDVTAAMAALVESDVLDLRESRWQATSPDPRGTQLLRGCLDLSHPIGLADVAARYVAAVCKDPQCPDIALGVAVDPTQAEAWLAHHRPSWAEPNPSRAPRMTP